MGYDTQRGSAGTVVAIVAVIVVLLMGGLVLVGAGAMFWWRAEARQVEMVARVEADRAAVEVEKAEGLAGRVQVKESAKLELLEAPAHALIIEIDQEGAITVDDERLDLDGLRAQIQKAGENSNVRLTVQLKVHPRCLAQHVLAVQSICRSTAWNRIPKTTANFFASGKRVA